MTRETQYCSKKSAIRGMWRAVDTTPGCNSPLIGDDGTTLQWVDDRHGTTRYMSVTRADGYDNVYILIRSWIE